MIRELSKALRMMVILVSGFTASASSANPRVTSDYILGSEAVNVDVSIEASYVKGNFEFVLKRHLWDYLKSGEEHQTFRPIFDLPIAVLPSEKDTDDSIATATPQMYLNGKVYVGVDPDDDKKFFRAMGNRSVSWKMTEFFTEYAKFGKTFVAEIQYVQRNLVVDGKRLFFYLPLIPSFDEFPEFYPYMAKNYRIRIRPLPGVSIRKYDENYELKAIDDSAFEITPERGKVLTIEVVSIR